MIAIICGIWILLLAIIGIMRLLGIKKGSTEDLDHNDGLWN